MSIKSNYSKIGDYNQNEYGIGPDCVPTTCMQIIKKKYGIDCQYSFLNKISLKAISIGVLFKTLGAKFETYYNWFVGEINNQTGLNFEISKQYLLGTYFEEALENNGFFGLRLKNGNANYLSAIEKGYLTKDDIDSIVKLGGGFEHNHCYGKDTIYEVYGGKSITAPLDILKYGTTKGVFGYLGRDIIPADEFTTDVCELLVKLRDDVHYDPYNDYKTVYEKTVYKKAMDLIYKYEIKPINQ